MLNKYLTTFIYIPICLFSSHSNKANGRHLSKQVKPALIYQLCEHIIWPNEQGIESFHAAFYGKEDKTYHFFKKDDSDFKDKKLIPRKIHHFKSLDDIQILILDEVSSKNLDEIASQISGKGILLISQESKDLKNVMINLIKDPVNQTLTFEVNKANIISEGLKIDPELLLLKGTEIDIRQLYREMRQELQEERNAVNVQKELIKRQEHIILGHRNEIIQLKEYSEELNTDIGSRAFELQELLNTIEDKETQLKARQYDFNQQLIHFKELERQVDIQQSLISSTAKTLDSLENEAFKQRAYINKQSLNLSIKEEKINAQRSAIYLIGGLVMVILVLLVFSYRAYRSKGIIADELTTTVKKLNQQYVDNLNLNSKLVELNQKLELKVSERTAGLKEKDKQLSEYTFINSHLLRAPLSKILGLAELLQTETTENNQFMLFALKESADELDSIVREINRLLSEQGGFDRNKLDELINKRV